MATADVECAECRRSFKNVVAWATHIARSHPELGRAGYYDRYLLADRSEKECKTCKGVTTLISLTDGYHQYCSTRCMARDPDVRMRTKETNIERYGVSTALADKKKMADAMELKYGAGMRAPLLIPGAGKKFRSTCRKHWGQDHFSSSLEIKKKKIQTAQKHFGVDHTFQAQSVIDKSQRTWNDRYGADRQGPISKMKCTNIERYGVECISQRRDYFERMQRSRCRTAEFEGRSMIVQGWENTFLESIGLLVGPSHSDVMSHNREVPLVKWKDKEGVSHTYHPDFWLRSQDLLVEVKSTWTWNKLGQDEQRQETNLRKLAAALLQHNVLLMILDTKRSFKWYRFKKSEHEVHLEDLLDEFLHESISVKKENGKWQICLPTAR
jgi:hypothetical protein